MLTPMRMTVVIESMMLVFESVMMAMMMMMAMLKLLEKRGKLSRAGASILHS